jgi:Ca2+-binding EF-hand superfamily protein
LLNISIFDEHNTGLVDYKELFLGLEMFKDNMMEEKFIGI